MNPATKGEVREAGRWGNKLKGKALKHRANKEARFLNGSFNAY